MAPGALAQVLRDLPKVENSKLLVGFDTADDACVYQLSESLALVQTVDFFPPMVDDPYVFGQIAAANALSDIYAMGATPTHAMNLLCFPSCLELEVAAAILAGGADKAAEAGCVIAGGHSITDNEPKYGLCVSGFVDPRQLLRNSTAQAGDVLILTKPLGTGILTTAFKGGVIDETELAPALASMTTLNKAAAEAAHGLEVHACTDITGFGLAGHLCELAAGNGLTAVLTATAIPALPQALTLAAQGMIPGGAYRNRDHFGPQAELSALSPELTDLVFDPQTSGGLLLAIGEDQAEELLSRLGRAGVAAVAIGVMRPDSGLRLRAE